MGSERKKAALAVTLLLLLAGCAGKPQDNPGEGDGMAGWNAMAKAKNTEAAEEVLQEESITEAEGTASEMPEAPNPTYVDEMYDYDVETSTFTFSTSGESRYLIPYAKITGCPDDELEWEVNHLLWHDACWLFDCAYFDTVMYDHLFREKESGDGVKLTDTYRCGRYLSVVYENTVLNDIMAGKIAYAIVVDMMTGKRLLLKDVLEDEEAFREILLNYFGDEPRETLRLDEYRVDQIMLYGGMTEAEILDYNTSGDEKGNVTSVSYFFDTASFYMTEEELVVMPGISFYEPVGIAWDRLEGIVKEEVYEGRLMEAEQEP